jgi:glycosyltransferase involved in cell wall biosynthesis
MRIAVFIKRTTFQKGSGGMETQNKVLCEALVEQGHSVTVFAPLWELEKKTETLNGVTYVFVDSVYRTLSFSASKKNWVTASTEAFTNFHAKEPFDLILGQSSAALGLIKVKEEHGLPVVSISHGSMMSEIQTRLKNLHGFKDFVRVIPDLIFSLYIFFGRQREFIHGSDKVICVSNFVKDRLLEETYVSEDKLVVVHNGVYLEGSLEKSEALPVSALSGNLVDSAPTAPFGGSGSVSPSGNSAAVASPGLLYVGRLEREKGTLVLAELLKDPRFRDTEIDIIGTGPEETVLRELSGGNEKHTVHGRVPHEEVLHHYRSNKIFIFPTNRLEGFPMVLVEAMFGGCAAVAFDMGGVSDAIEHNVTGVLVSSGDPSDFISEVLKLLDDSSSRFSLGEGAKHRAQKEYTVGTMVSTYLSIMNGFIKK